MSVAEIIAPSGQVLDMASLDRAIDHLRARGWTVREAPQLRACVERFAGDDAARAAAFEAALTAPDADLVIAARGGYGLSRLMARIDWKRVAAAMRERGTVFVGHSDITAAQLALLCEGAPSLAGPMACYDLGAEMRSAFTEANFWCLLDSDRHQVTIEREASDGEPEVEAEGLLWGGNLSLVSSLAGTPWMPAVDGGIVFLEDVAEHPYRVERMLSQLLHAGVLARQRAVLLGGFTDYRLFPNDNGYDMPGAIAWLRANCPVPIVTGLPFGHVRDKLTLPVGGLCRLRSDRSTLDLILQNPYPPRAITGP